MSQPSYLIIGATGGIGSAIARRLSASGADLMLVSTNEEKLTGLAAEVGGETHVADATQFAEIDQAVKATVEAFTKLDGVINCVGSVLLKPAHLTSQADLEKTLALNITTAFACVRASFSAMKADGGSIVLFSSAAARIGLPNHEAIAAAKGAVNGLVQSAAATYASQNIRINAIAPGLVETPMTEMIWSRPKSAEVSRKMHGLGRLGQPEKIASLAAWLMDSENDWITGQIIGCDGGLADLKTN